MCANPGCAASDIRSAIQNETEGFQNERSALVGCHIAGRTRGALLALRCGVSIGTDISRERLGNAFLTAMLPSCGLHQPRTKVGTPRELEASNFARPDVHGDNEE
jgi:hypothetical protein